jgi:hypothetical protein
MEEAAMIPKRPDGNKGARSRLSLVSPLLKSAVHGAKAEPATEEPWRNRKQLGKNNGGRSK